MRLASLTPALPTELVKSLEQAGYRTEADILLASTPMEVFCRLPPDIVSFEDLNKYISLIAKLSSAPGHSGAELLALENSRYTKRLNMSSGIHQLDKLLAQSSLLEVSGDKDSGKTCLLLHIVFRHLVTYSQSSVAWIDTRGEFSVERAARVAEAVEGGQRSASTLHRLQVSLAFDLDTVQEVLEEIRYSRSIESPLTHTWCIVIDSITPLFSPLLSPTSSRGHAIMTTFMRQLRSFSETHPITIFVINDSTACTPSNPDTVFHSTRKAALGPSFTFLSDATIWLSRPTQDETNVDTDEVQAHIIEILRSKRTQSKIWCSFKVKDGILVT